LEMVVRKRVRRADGRGQQNGGATRQGTQEQRLRARAPLRSPPSAVGMVANSARFGYRSRIKTGGRPGRGLTPPGGGWRCGTLPVPPGPLHWSAPRTGASRLLDLHGGTGFFELRLDRVGLVLGHALFDRLRGRVDEVLRFLEAEPRDRADDLDHLDLLP